MKYQLQFNNTKLTFKTETQGLNALISKWYYDKFPYRWHNDPYGNTVLNDDFLAEYNKRKLHLIETFQPKLREYGIIQFEGYTLSVVSD